MQESYGARVGLDWASGSHAVCWREVATGKVHIGNLPHSSEEIGAWLNKLRAGNPQGRIAICLEQSRGAVIYALMGYEFVDLYPVNPVQLASYRKTLRPSGAKDDPDDAALALDLLETHRDKLAIWHPDSEATRLLRSRCEDRRKNVDLRTALCHRLRAKLREYFPQALELVGSDLFSKLSCALLMKWPRFEAVAAARPDTLRRFYYAHHLRCESVIAQRLNIVATGQPICTDEAVVQAGILTVRTLVGVIRSLNPAINSYDRRIAEVFQQHPEHFSFQSLPGAGANLAPRLLITFGTDRSRFPDAAAVAAYTGVAPVVERSGHSCWTHWRWHCPKFLRQSLVEFAAHSIPFSPWAQLYYQDQRRRGKRHQAAVRALAFKWVRIIFRCWQDRVPYDEATHLASLRQHGSWIADQLEEAA